MSCVGVTAEFKDLGVWQLQDLLELLADVRENLTALLWCSALSTCSVSISTSWNALSNCSGPYTNTVESLSHIDDNAHNFSIVLVFESFADGGEKNMKPDLVDRNTSLVLKLV